MTSAELTNTLPQLRTSGRLVCSSSDTAPTVDEDGAELQVGTELLHDDTGMQSYWDGEAWQRVHVFQRVNQLAEFLREIRDLLTTRED